MLHLGNEWDSLLQEETGKPYYQQLRAFLADEYRSHTIYPDMYHIFTALKLTNYCDVRVVILGQDPYHGENQAHGLAFSVQPGVRIPPSLANIFLELHQDCDCSIPQHGCLEAWAKQGVLLLNTVLTVRSGEANSHKGKGWERFTDHLITLLNQRITQKGIIFLLWGANAAKKRELITDPAHHVLVAPHPSPLSASRGFLGCGHFSSANRLLVQSGRAPIDWQIR